MEVLLLQFINQYFGLQNVGDTDQNKGECVGVIEVWTDTLKLPHTWGNAIDLLKNADPNHFIVVYNNPNDYNQFPPVGAILVLDKTWGNGLGHTGIIIRANGHSYSLFEANNPEGARPTIINHPNYSGVLGWMIKK